MRQTQALHSRPRWRGGAQRALAMAGERGSGAGAVAGLQPCWSCCGSERSAAVVRRITSRDPPSAGHRSACSNLESHL